MDQLKSLREQIERPNRRLTFGGSARLWPIAGAKGGTGRSTIAGLLALALARQGNKTLLVDGNFSLPALPFLFDKTQQAQTIDFLRDLRPEKQMVARISANLDLLALHGGPAFQSSEAGLILDKLLQQFGMRYQHIVFDLPTGHSAMLQRLHLLSGNCTIIAGPLPAEIAGCYALMKLLKLETDVSLFHVVLNRCRVQKQAEQYFEKLQQISRHFLEFTPVWGGWIAEHPQVLQQAEDAVPINDWRKLPALEQSITQLIAAQETMMQSA